MPSDPHSIKWFMYVLPEEAAKYELDSDGPDSCPVLEGETMCSMGVWADGKDGRKTASQVGQVERNTMHEEWGTTWMSIVQEFCEQLCDLEEVHEFYLWDDAEGGWWYFQFTDRGDDYPGQNEPSWQCIENGDDGVWTIEDLI